MNGARSRTRTGTPLLARDFKSPASTDFAIRAVALCKEPDYIQPSPSSQGMPKHIRGNEKGLVNHGSTRPFKLEAEVGIEPAFTDLQSEVKPNNFKWLTVDNFRIIAVFVSLEAAD